MKNLAYLLYFIATLSCITNAEAQLAFNMSDTLVTECKGRLYDNGGPGANYAHNSNITFTICLNNPGPITLSFLSFCVEADFDSLRIFDGPNINSPQLGPTLWGNSIPASVTAMSGCMTLNFRSDANVACTGWIADWSTLIEPPIPPTITASTLLPACQQTAINVNLSQAVLCDSIYAGVFSLSGPSNNTIVNANAINCIGGNTTAANLTINPGLVVGGIYTLTYTYRFLDLCDSLWIFQQSYPIEVFDCPIEVELIAVADSLCNSQCTFISAVATGGNGQYSYVWNNGLPPTAGPHLICPSGTTTYTVTVDDTSPAFPASASQTIIVFPKTQASDDLSICQSEDEILLTGSPAGGTWLGQGIVDATNGIFNPDSALVGINTIEYAFYYSNTFFCSDTVLVDMRPIFAGPDQAACPGSAPFQLTGNEPTGGTWSGPFTNINGIFDPQTAGVYQIEYTYDNCTATKNVYVELISNLPIGLDTICQSAPNLFFNLSPPGGIWSGSGIIDSLSGEFSPEDAFPGLQSITYSLNGCAEQFDVFINAIDAGNDFFACPAESPFVLNNFSPVGGFWSGMGILDANTGLFDPGFNSGNFTATLIYNAPNGCSDTILGRVRTTLINEEYIEFCLNDDPLILRNNTVGNVPPNGNWIGAGITQDTDGNYFFNPALAGQGIHFLIYEANTCSDSLQMIVYDQIFLPINEVCELNPPFIIPVETYVGNGTFSGQGIIDGITGVFSPTAAGAGSHIITFTSPKGCTDEITIEVGDFNVANINSIAPLCYRDTIILLQANPPGGTFSGPGITDNTFNPILADAGIHQIEYIAGEGFCLAVAQVEIIVFPRVNYTTNVSNDSLCSGEFSNININAFGGNGSLITYQWSNGLPSTAQQIVSPAESETYIVTISDGCTIVSDTIPIFVAPAINYDLIVDDINCFGNPSNASVNLFGASYDISWRTGNTIVSGPNLLGNAGVPYTLTITDTETNCKKDTTFVLPSHPPINADFLINPAPIAQCLEFDQKEISLIDLSQGGFTGSWDMGDQTTYSYELNQNLTHSFDEPGSFNINLLIFDEFGCKDSQTKSICILDRSSVYMPNTFTPNGDFINDILSVYGSGIKKIDVYVYDRRGILMAHATALGNVWDGNRPDGRPAMDDVYAYLIELTWEKGSFFTKTGTVTLIR